MSDRSGSVFIAQGDEIRVFDARGKHLRTIGRDGEGPGEFRYVSTLGWTGDTLFAYDSVLRRITWFTEEGSVVRTRSLGTAPEGSRDEPLSTGGSIPLRGDPIAASVDGSIIVQYVGGGTAISDGTLTSLPVVRVHETEPTTVLDRLDVRGTYRTFRTPRTDLAFVPPVAWRSLVATHPGGSSLTFVHQDEPRSTDSAYFRVRRVSSSGQVIFARSYRYTPRQLSAQVKDSILAKQMSGPGPQAAGMSRSDVQRILGLPTFWPAVADIVEGQDGSTWLELGHDGAIVTWTVLDPAGEPVGVLQLPSSTRILHARQGQIWTAQKDGLDIPYAVRMQITRR